MSAGYMCIYNNAQLQPDDTLLWNNIRACIQKIGTMYVMGFEISGSINTDNIRTGIFIPDAAMQWLGLNVSEPPTLYSADNTIYTGTTCSRVDNAGYFLTVDISAIVRSETRRVMVGRRPTVPCFHRDTLIRTRVGNADVMVPVHELRPGQRVVVGGTGTSTAKIVRMTNDRSCNCFCFKVNSLGPGMPSRPLIVTGNHLLQYGSRIVRADRLLMAIHINATLRVYHILLDEWAFVHANDVLAESCAWKPEHYAIRPSK